MYELDLLIDLIISKIIILAIIGAAVCAHGYGLTQTVFGTV